MLKTLLSTTALVMVLASPLAAQTPMEPQAPATGAQESAPGGSPMLPDTTAPSDPAAAPAGPATAPDMTAPAPNTTADAGMSSEPFIAEQAADQMLASDLIGVTIVNAADEDLGDVNDILLDENHQVVAVIVGVGGFLGIGEKSVAVPFDRLNVSTDADGNHVISLDTTTEELEAAPDFVTLASARSAAEQQIQQDQLNQSTPPAAAPSTAPMDPAPAPSGPAPAPAPAQ